MKVVAIIITCVIAVGVIVTVGLAVSHQSKDYTEIGTFLVLGSTLIGLILYAYDTNRMATVIQGRTKE